MATSQPGPEITSGNVLARERPSLALAQEITGLENEVVLGWTLKDWALLGQACEGAELTVQECF